MKKIVIYLSLILSIFLIAGCAKKEEKLTDAEKFKNEYESINDTKVGTHDIRNISIPEDNPFIYKTADEIVEMMENKESFAVYFGFSTCPWCRSVLPTLIDVLDDLDLNKIYYVDVLDIRDTLSLNDEGKVETTKKGSDAYYKLLELMDNVLTKYTLQDSKGKMIDTKEKRIMAPNIVSVIDGKANKLTTGISSKQTDGYMELTDEMKKDTYEQIKCVLECLQNEPEKCGVGC